MHRFLAGAFIVSIVISAGCDKLTGGNPAGPSSVGGTTNRATVVAWSATGTGPRIIDLPTSVTQIRIEGEYTGSSQNFVVWCGADSYGDAGGLLVNTILGTFSGSTRYAGVHAARRDYNNQGDPCRQLEVVYSERLRWTITETAPRRGVSSNAGISPNASTGSRTGDMEAVRRARERIRP